MTKRLVDIDDQLLERARAATGEKTIRGTIEHALKKVVNEEVLQDYMAFLRRGEYELSPEEVRALREPDYPIQADDDD